MRVLGVIALLALVTLARPAVAQSTSDKAAAQAQFDEARKLLKMGDTAAACDKLAESQRLEPAVGTLLNLATCYEKLGRTARSCCSRS